MEKVILKGLKAESFIHPGDRVAIGKLDRYTAFKRMMQKFLEEGMEDDVYLMSLADNVKLYCESTESEI